MLYALLPSTVDAESAKGVDVEYGIEVSGEWGGKWRAKVKDGKFEVKPETDNFEGVRLFSVSTLQTLCSQHSSASRAARRAATRK